MLSRYCCTKCQIQFVTEINGVKVVEMSVFGPLAIYHADQYTCPICGDKQLSYHKPYLQGDTYQIQEEIIRCIAEGDVLHRIWLNQSEKHKYHEQLDEQAQK